MRRGFMHWSQRELPAAALDARVARLQSAMRSQGLGAVLAYASFAQPAPLQWLCNYIPYWSEAVIVVWDEGAPTMLVAGTPRTHSWIRSVSHVGDLVAAPKPGAQVAELLGSKLPARARLGVIGLDGLPWSIAEPMLAAGWGTRWEDATATYISARHPGDEAEYNMARIARAMAEHAIAAIPPEARQTSEIIAAMDGAARLAGAEEVLPRIAPDLQRATALLRVEGKQATGQRYGVECSVAYKGVWVRVGRSIARASEPASWAAAEAWFDRSLPDVGGTRPIAEIVATAPGKVAGWTLEASTGVAPLSVIAGSGQPALQRLPINSLAVFSVQLTSNDGCWLRSAPLRLGVGAHADAKAAAVTS